MTRLLPDPLAPTVRVVVFNQRELVPVTSTELFEDEELLPMVPAVFLTVPLEMTRLLLDPLLPTLRVVAFDQTELLPVTSTELFEELLPMVPVVFCTFPPSEMIRLLPDPLLPTIRATEFDQRELLPVTKTELFEDEELLPMVPAAFLTVPPLEMIKLLPAPLWPREKAPEFNQRELVPVTRTELFEAVVSTPMNPLEFCTEPPLEITMLLLLPELPTTRLEELLTRVFVLTTVRLFPLVTLLVYPT